MNFRRWVVFTFLVHIAVIAIDKGGGIVLFLLLANLPDEHGKSSIVASLPFILGAIANLGLATALVYFVRRGRYSPQVCFETSIAVAIGWGSLVAVAAATCLLFVLPALRPEWTFDPMLVLPICAAVPLLLVASYANSTQLATDRIRDYGIVHLATSLTFLPAFFACFYLFGADSKGDAPPAVAWGRLGSTVLVVVVTLWLVRGVVALRARVHRDFLNDALRYGWRANITSTLTYLNHRLDLIVLGVIVAWIALDQGKDEKAAGSLANTQVAFYSLAVTWAELVWHFPEAMRDLFFSKVAGSSHEQARTLTPLLARLGLVISLVGVLGILLLVDPVMGTLGTLARGADDAWTRTWSGPVGNALLLLVPGTAAYTVSKVLQADLAARNELQTCVNAQSLVFVTMIAGDLLLIPAHGASGAALASTVAYLVGTVYTVFAYSRQTRVPPWQCLFVQASDFRYIREICVAVLGKLRRTRA